MLQLEKLLMVVALGKTTLVFTSTTARVEGMVRSSSCSRIRGVDFRRAFGIRFRGRWARSWRRLFIPASFHVANPRCDWVDGNPVLTECQAAGRADGAQLLHLAAVGVGEIFIGIEPQDSAFTAFLTHDRSATPKKRKSNFAENRAPVRGGQAGGAVGIGPPLVGAGGPSVLRPGGNRENLRVAASERTTSESQRVLFSLSPATHEPATFTCFFAIFT